MLDHHHVQPSTNEHHVSLTLAYSNPNPQLDGLLEHLTSPSPTCTEHPGPSYDAEREGGGLIETNYGRSPRPLNKRFSPKARSELATAFASGVKQKDLALQYGVSIRSVKRLIQQARLAGTI
ncbi:hypothetical protein [Glycomyces tenuis]|uniref:hypothetical protein n=1 Tax=Glycomyces tenuis TaxID=58116 RepID=UPI0012DC9230|nr:hypothetical protein [Glycomyces tenuis]